MISFMVSNRWGKLVRFFLTVLGVLCLAALEATAADLYWNGTIDDWSVAANWGGTLPTSDDVAHVLNGGTVQITQPNAACNFLYLGLDEGSSGTVEMSDGTLSVLGRTCVGNGGVGTFTQTGGVHTAGNMDVGYGDGSNGTYVLSGGQLAVWGDENIGMTASARGRFEQTGGTHTVGSLSIGPGGVYSLSGGTLEIGSSFQNAGILDGENGSGTINALNAIIMDFSSGQYVNAGSLTLSLPAGSLAIVPAGFDPAVVFGTYSNAGLTHVLGTTLNLASGQSIAGSGMIVDPVVCAGNITATDAITLNGGLSLSAGTVQLGKGNLITDGSASGISGGTLLATRHYVGYTGSGTFTQTGGSHSPASLHVGCAPGATGTYVMSGGSLTPPTQFIGYTSSGALTQSAGTNRATVLAVGEMAGSTGSYELSGGTVTSTYEYVGHFGSGVFLHSGGSNTATGPLTVGFGPGTTGSYTMSGTASLTVYSEMVGYQGTGTFSHSAGTAKVSTSLTLGSGNTSKGTYNLSGTGSLLAAQETIGFGGVGIFNHETGGNLVSGGIAVGTNSTSNGTYNLTGAGFVSASQIAVGGFGVGTFTQSAGTVSLFGSYQSGQDGSLIVAGSGGTGRGTYNLSGTGSLLATTETVGGYGVGVFNQSGGTNTVLDTLQIAYPPSTQGSGTYNLSDTGQLIAGYEYLGPGYAVFNQSGGVHQVPGFMDMGGSKYIAPAFYVPTYNLTGGTLSVEFLTIGYRSGSAVFVNSGGGHYVGQQLVIGSDGSSQFISRYTLSGTGTLTVSGSQVGILVGVSYPSRFEWFNNGLTTSGMMVGNYGTLALGFDGDLSEVLSGSAYHGGPLLLNSKSVVEITNGATVSCSAGGLPIVQWLGLGTATGSGNLNISGSASIAVTSATIGESTNGTVTQTGGIFTLAAGNGGLTLAVLPGSQGVYNLNGGTLSVPQITAGKGTASFNFGGGTLQSVQPFVTTLPMTLTGIGGNAHIDTSLKGITLIGLLSGPGGLEKSGDGLLQLGARNSYSGDTIVRGGTLTIGNGIDPAGTKLIDVQGGWLSFYTVTVDRPDLVVNVAAGSTFQIQGGDHTVGSITGAGTTRIDGGSLTVGSLQQDSLIIGVQSGAQCVPEPGAVVLLVSGLAIAGWMRRLLKRS